MPSLAELGVSDKGLLFINGEFVAPASGEWLDIVNPATEEVIYKMPRGTKPDVDAAVAAARAAFDSWSSTPAAERAKYMVAIADEIEKNSAMLSAIETMDNGKPKVGQRTASLLARLPGRGLTRIAISLSG